MNSCSIPKALRIFFKYRRRLLGELSRAAVKALTVYFEALAGEPLVPGIIVAVQTFGDRINFHARVRVACPRLAKFLAVQPDRLPGAVPGRRISGS